MKLLWNDKDGGPESRVWMYGFESKRFGSALLLRFEDGSREAYHSHAFLAVSWVLWGLLLERFHGYYDWTVRHFPSVRPIITHRDTFHKVTSVGRTWVLSFRGPWWTDAWFEFIPGRGEITLTHGRREVAA